jgi:hypothetical protein
MVFGTDGNLTYEGQIMNRYRAGIMCPLAAVTVALAAFLPAAVVRNPWRKGNPIEPDEAYLGATLLRAALIALAGPACSYVLFRSGSHLKSQRRSGIDSH